MTFAITIGVISLSTLKISGIQSDRIQLDSLLNNYCYMENGIPSVLKYGDIWRKPHLPSSKLAEAID